jgi:hypothetical protein
MVEALQRMGLKKYFWVFTVSKYDLQVIFLHMCHLLSQLSLKLTKATSSLRTKQ